jgi:hypothetical protein
MDRIYIEGLGESSFPLIKKEIIENVEDYAELVYWYPHNGVQGSLGLETISGGAFYHCDKDCYPPELEGAYFFGDFGVGFIGAVLPSSTIDPVTGVARAHVRPIMYGLYLGPVDLQVWDGKVYFSFITGSVAVLDYD